MRLWNYFIWCTGFVLEITLLIRGFYTKLLWLYPWFHVYIFFVLAQSIVRAAAHRISEDVYSYTYWITEFLGIAIGCLVVFEIYRIGLAAYRGTARMARRVLAVLFILAVTKALVDASQDPRYWAEATAVDVERAVRTVQALAIAALVTLFLVYAVPFGRNLRGLLFGYGLFVGVSMLGFTVVQGAGSSLRHVWSYLNPACYGLALGLWVVYLWVPQTHPVPQSMRMEEQYQQVAARTRRRLKRARGYLGKGMDR
jgi:hypothetical protein